MKRKIKIVVANPAGNITIFVKDKFERQEYQNVAKQLLAMSRLEGEQVAFVLDTPECGRADGKVEMCGLEFCGNASRAFGLLRAREMGLTGKGQVFVDMSGCDEILTIDVDVEEGYTKVKMPKPLSVTKLDLSELKIGDAGPANDAGDAGRAIDAGDAGRAIDAGDASHANDAGDASHADLVDLDGIMHVVLKNVEASKETFDKIKEFVMGKYNTPAMGVMFYNPEEESLIPVVYVKDVDSTYFEGSCGSGVTACAAAFSKEREDGTYHFAFAQPGGNIDSTVSIAGGEIENIFIEGTVALSEEMEVEIEI